MATILNYIVSAADENYFRSFLQLYYSYLHTKEYDNSGLIFYDIGLNDGQIQHFKELQSKASFPISYRKFEFNTYPEFVGLEYKTYSWKRLKKKIVQFYWTVKEVMKLY